MTLLALLCALPLQAVAPGEAVVGRLEPGRDAEHELAAGTAGMLTVTVESYDFDPELAVLDGRGAIAGHAAGQGPAARVAVDGDGSGGWRAVVAAEGGGGGRYLLTLRPGDAAEPDEGESAALRRVYGAFADDEQARGNAGEAHELVHRLGEQLFARADYPAAGPVFRRALELAQARGNDWGAAVERAFLGAVERRVGSDEAAVELLVAAAGALEGRAPPRVGCFVFENLGEALFDLGRDAEALEAFEAWRLRAAAAGLAPLQALALTRVGRMQMLLGDPSAAARSHEDALARLDGVDDTYVASQVLLAAGQFEAGRSRLDEARRLLERALDLPTTWEVALAIDVHLGGVLLQQGRYGPARAGLDRARARLEGRGDRRLEVALLDGLADLAAGMGDLPGAAELMTRALAAAEAAGDVRARIDLLTDLGAVHEQLEEFARAEEAYGRAEELCAGLDDAARRFRIAHARGRLAHQTGHPHKALALQSRALELALALDDPVNEAMERSSLAWTSMTLGRLDDAREQARRARGLFERAGLVDDLLVGPLHTLARVALLAGEPDEAEALLAIAEEIIEREDVVGLAPRQAAGVRSAFAAWGEVAQDLVMARLAGGERNREALLARGMAEAGRWKGRALLEGMRLPAADGPASLATVRAALGGSRALVEYVRDSRDLHAYVLDARGLQLVHLGPAEGLDAQVGGYLAGMAAIDALAPPERLARDGAALHARILAPVLEVLRDDVRGLVIVATPGLVRLSFEALVTAVRPAPDGSVGFDDVDFLADRYDVSYGPSVPVLARLAGIGPRGGPGRTLLLGDPDYAGSGYPSLPASRDEVLSIAAALEPGSFDLHLGREATGARLSGDLRRYAVIHAAAHGEVDPLDPLRSGLVLSDDGDAGRFLSLADILRCELDADMVVLSACGTARGRVLEGEGVQSLAQAFLQAGARSVVASLWSADDLATRQIMARFYRGVLEEGRDPARALREARVPPGAERAARRWPVPRGAGLGGSPGPAGPGDPRHPYFWAPFIYVGAIPAE